MFLHITPDIYLPNSTNIKPPSLFCIQGTPEEASSLSLRRVDGSGSTPATPEIFEKCEQIVVWAIGGWLSHLSLCWLALTCRGKVGRDKVSVATERAAFQMSCEILHAKTPISHLEFDFAGDLWQSTQEGTLIEFLKNEVPPIFEEVVGGVEMVLPQPKSGLPTTLDCLILKSAERSPRLVAQAVVEIMTELESLGQIFSTLFIRDRMKTLLERGALSSEAVTDNFGSTQFQLSAIGHQILEEGRTDLLPAMPLFGTSYGYE